MLGDTLHLHWSTKSICGPLLDRIDIHVEVPAAEFKELSSAKLGTSSASIREEVLNARKAQLERFDGMSINYNAQMSSRQIRKYCKLNDECLNVLKISVNELGLSARAHDKVLRLSRTIADLEASTDIQVHHLTEAINYRMLENVSYKRTALSSPPEASRIPSGDQLKARAFPVWP